MSQHLGRMTLGEPDLEIEVLALFSAQSHDLIGRLASMPVDAAALAHTLKGSARAIGAFRVADAALGLEAAMRSNADLPDALSTLQAAVAEARATIDRMLNRSLSSKSAFRPLRRQGAGFDVRTSAASSVMYELQIQKRTHFIELRVPLLVLKGANVRTGTLASGD